MDIDLYSEILTAMLLTIRGGIGKNPQVLQKRHGKSGQLRSCMMGYFAANFKMPNGMEKYSWSNIEWKKTSVTFYKQHVYIW